MVCASVWQFFFGNFGIVLLTLARDDDMIVSRQSREINARENEMCDKMITANFTVYWGLQTRIIHDTSVDEVKAMPGFVSILSVQDEPHITHAMITSNGKFSCE